MKIKVDNKESHKAERIFDGLFLVMFLIIFAWSLWLYGVSYHDIDLGQNLRVINAQVYSYGFQYTDTTSGNITVNPDILYRTGLNQMQFSFILLGISAFFLGVFIARLMTKH